MPLRRKKRVRTVKPQKTVTFAPTTETQGNNAMEQKIKQLEIEQISVRREIQQASVDAHF